MRIAEGKIMYKDPQRRYSRDLWLRLFVDSKVRAHQAAKDGLVHEAAAWQQRAEMIKGQLEQELIEEKAG
jgi:hypothetical protein